LKRVALVLGLWALAAPAWANTMELYGFGARQAALGNTSEAVVDDFWATYGNPANLSLRPHIHLGFGTNLVWNRFRIDRLGAIPPPTLPADNVLAHLGVSSPLPGWLGDKASIGVAFHLPVGADTRLDSHDPSRPQVTLYDTLGDRLALVFGVGVRPVRWLAFGVSAQLLTTLQGSASVDLSVLDRRNTRKQMDVELLTKPYPIVGLTLLPSEGVRVGLVWRSQSLVRYQLPLSVAVQDVGQLQFTLAGTGLFLPDVWAVAASWQRGPWLATVGAAWLRWSQLPPLAAEVHLKLDDSLLRPGKTDALLQADRTPIAVGARDIVQPRAGIEWRPNEPLVVRAGLQYRPTFLPRADGPANYLDAPAWTMSAGVGVRTDDPTRLQARPLQVDATVAYTALETRTVYKAVDPASGTSLAGGSWHVALGLHHDF
jgi:long-subunit fatty acid transport protein